jgi:hypothetical protein
MMQPLESFDSSHPSVPRNPPPNWESVCAFDEEDEIRFVEHEDKSLRSHSKHRFRVYSKQKARRVPGPVYFPALIVVW